MSNSVQPLPEELYGLFIDALADDSTSASASAAALRSCSLVSHSFLNSARKHIFATITIYLMKENLKLLPSQYAEYLNTISKLLQQSLEYPGIGMAYHIRSFRLQIEVEEAAYKLLQHAHIPGILNALCGPNHGIQQFTMELIPQVDFLKLVPVLQTSLVGICRYPLLNSLRLRGFSKLPSTLLLDTQIKCIHFDQSSLASSKPPPGGQQRTDTVALMDSITVDDSFSFVDLLHPNDKLKPGVRYRQAFSNLTHLELCARNPDNLPSLVSLALYASETLQVLSLATYGGIHSGFPGISPWFDTPPFNLQPLEKLHTLKISSRMSSGSADYFVFPLARVLEKISNLPPNLKLLSLRGRSDIQEGEGSMIDWGPLEKIISQPSYRKISRIVLSLAYCTYSRPDLNNEDRSEFHHQLKSFAETGLPSVKSIQCIDCTCAYD